MVISLRKFLFLVLMTLALLAGTLGISARAITAPLTPLHHVSIQTQNPLLPSGSHINCPPPPYDC